MPATILFGNTRMYASIKVSSGQALYVLSGLPGSWERHASHKWHLSSLHAPAVSFELSHALSIPPNIVHSKFPNHSHEQVISNLPKGS